MRRLEELFHTTPLYGDQTDALWKIARGVDRAAYMLLNSSDEPLGVLVFKKEPSNEFRELGVQAAVELKTLFGVAADKNSGRGLGSHLLGKCLEHAVRVGAECCRYGF